MERGYVKLWRKSLDTAIFNNPNAWLFWCYCLMKAAHKKRTVLHGNQTLKLKPGQFVFGRKKASHETGLSEQNIRTCLKILDSMGYLTIKPTNKYSIINIINWDTYQPESNQINQQITSKQPANNHKQELNNNIYTSNFEQFWSAYPKKIGKGAAFKAYQNIKQPRPSLNEILESLSDHQKTDQWQNKKFIPNPSTWLNQRRWEDETQDKPKQKISVFKVASNDL